MRTHPLALCLAVFTVASAPAADPPLDPAAYGVVDYGSLSAPEQAQVKTFSGLLERPGFDVPSKPPTLPKLNDGDNPAEEPDAIQDREERYLFPLGKDGKVTNKYLGRDQHLHPARQPAQPPSAGLKVMNGEFSQKDARQVRPPIEARLIEAFRLIDEAEHPPAGGTAPAPSAVPSEDKDTASKPGVPINVPALQKRFKEIMRMKTRPSEPAAAPEATPAPPESPAIEVGSTPFFSTLPAFRYPETLVSTYVRSPEGLYPAADPFKNPPGTNMLPTVYENSRDRRNVEMRNTLPSTPTNPYNLHDGDPKTTSFVDLHMSGKSPTDDLRYIMEHVFELVAGLSPKRLLWEKESEDDTIADLIDAMVKLDTDAQRQARVLSNRDLIDHDLQWAIDMIRGNKEADTKVPGNRAYKGFPLLHVRGDKRLTRVVPIYDENKKIVGGNADVHQIWHDGRIESDTMFLDFGWHDYLLTDEQRATLPDPMPVDVPWTITYTIDVLHRGRDDFSPMTMFFDYPKFYKRPKEEGDPKEETPIRGVKLPKNPADGSQMGAVAENVAMDQTFFPMEENTRNVFKIKEADPRYFNLSYIWGWRVHPPRAQAIENSHTMVPPPPAAALEILALPKAEFDKLPEARRKEAIDAVSKTKRNIDWEKDVTEEKISDLAPAKRMLKAFLLAREALDPAKLAGGPPDFKGCVKHLFEARDAFLDWNDRNHLPSGVRPDPKTDLTLLFVNNTIYGEQRDGGIFEAPGWTLRPRLVKEPADGDPNVRVTLLNGDYFMHGYLSVDFGGNRGWENQFKSSLSVGGGGSFFTFGRGHWRVNTKPGEIIVPPANHLAATAAPGAAESFRLEPNPRMPRTESFVMTGGKDSATIELGAARVWMEMNFEPGRRLRFYQFDPLHHNVAIYSFH